jgi:hypothetical protein
MGQKEWSSVANYFSFDSLSGVLLAAPVVPEIGYGDEKPTPRRTRMLDNPVSWKFEVEVHTAPG